MPETDALQQFNPEDLKKRISEQVRTSWAMALPDAAFTQMVEKEIKEFFEEPADFTVDKFSSTGYHDTGSKAKLVLRMTPLRQMVWKEIHVRCKAELEVAMDQLLPTFITGGCGQWDQETGTMVNMPEEFHTGVSLFLEKRLKAWVPTMAENFFSGMFAQMIAAAKVEIKNEIVNPPY